MTELQSRFSLKQVIIIPLIITLLVGFIMTIICYASLNMIRNEQSEWYATPIWALVLFFALWAYSIRYYLILFKQYRFTERGFYFSNIFKKEFVSWATIREINIVVIGVEGFLYNYFLEDSSSIVEKSGRNIILFSKYYKNMPAIRRHLEFVQNQILLNKGIKEELPKKNVIQFDKNYRRQFSFIEFKGNFLLNSNGILISIFVLFSLLSLYLCVQSMNFFLFYFFMVFTLFFVFALGSQFYYFQFDGEYLKVRNHLFLFKSSKVKISDIRMAFVTANFKKSNSLRVVMNNFETKTFMAGSLKDKHWRELIQTLREHEIPLEENLFFE
ncbi:MAG: hypothetical protein ACSHXF_05420 [Aquaticitalea sp.]